MLLFVPDPAEGISDVEQKVSANLLADFLQKKETAAELHVCERTLDRWHALGMGPPRTHIGKKIFIAEPVYRSGCVRKSVTVGPHERSRAPRHRERGRGFPEPRCPMARAGHIWLH